MWKILVVEDEVSIREDLCTLLKNAGYQAAAAAEEDFSRAGQLVNRFHPDLILLDVNLKQCDGFAICKEIRRTYDVAIIFLTARDNVGDELKALSLGGDDFITKPYHPSVLLARIQTVLKRGKKGDDLEDQVVIYKGLNFDPRSYKIFVQDNEQELTKNECKLLAYLFKHKGEVIPRLDIVEYLWDNDVFIDDNALSVNITRLRNKLTALGLENYIETKRGVGYQI